MARKQDRFAQAAAQQVEVLGRKVKLPPAYIRCTDTDSDGYDFLKSIHRHLVGWKLS
jgi:hypothetical protein